MSDVALLVGGLKYEGWKSISISRSIETLAGSFSLSVTDTWSIGGASWPIREGNECSVLVGGVPLITGRVDSRKISYSATAHSIEIAGRDRAAVMVDASANLGKWEFRKVQTVELLSIIAAQFDMVITLDPSVVLPPIPEDVVSVTPGDSAFSLLDKVCKFAGVLPVSDGLGGITLMRPGLRVAATALVEGLSVKSASITYDVGDRFSEYVVMGQQTGGGKPVRGVYVDADVEDGGRVLIIQAETATSQDKADARARWEATTRAAKAERLSITTAGWEYGPGMVWSPGDTVSVRLPSLGVDGLMVIASVTLDRSGTSDTASLELVRPDAYTPALQSERAWKR